MSDASRPIASRFNVPDAFWHGLEADRWSLQWSCVRHGFVTLCLRELRDRRQVSTEEFFRLWAVRIAGAKLRRVEFLIYSGLAFNF